MKKIFLLFAAACLFVACDPVHEDFSNSGHITASELKAKSSVTVDKADDGRNGNVISCSTSAQVNAKWNIGGKDFIGNSAKKKMKLGEYLVYLTALCADGTILKDSFPVTCEVITDPLQKIYVYGEDPAVQPPFQPGGWDAAAMRFSDGEGKYFRYLTDDEYFGFKTLIVDVSDATDDCKMKIMNGWWSAFYYDSDPNPWTVPNGLLEVPINEKIAKDCARGNGGAGQDLQFMIVSGSCTINSVYYEE